MALGLFKLSGGGGQISSNHTFSNPILWEASSEGGVMEARYFLRMENPPTQFCTNGVIFAVDAAGEDESGWFSFAHDDGGGPGVYADQLPFEIPLNSEIPVWIRLALPTGIEQEPKDDIRVTATYIMHVEE
jgi:hypothetical protein